MSFKRSARHSSSVPSLISKESVLNAYHYAQVFGIRNLAERTLGMMMRGYRYNRYVRTHSVSSEELAVQSSTEFSITPVISIIVPTFNTPRDYLVQMIESVISQSYPHWELCIADGSPDHDLIESVVKHYQEKYPSILFRALEENLGIAGNTNAALEMATGDYIALLDHDDYLTPDALYEIVSVINDHPEADVLYTDEDKFDSSRNRYYDPNFKPDFDPDYLLCCNYITHFYIVRKTIVDQVQGFSTTMDGSQDYDFILRTTEKASVVCHIPKVLYHWRIHSNSVAGDPTSKMYAYDAAEHALNSHFQRCSIKASASKTANLGFYRTNYELQGEPLVSIIMTHCDHSLTEKLLQNMGYDKVEFVSKWSDVKGEYILFLDHIAEVSAESEGSFRYNWLSELVSNCQRPEIGIVSGKVLSSRERIYEFGLIYDKGGRIVSPFYHHPTAYPGYYHLTDSQHCVSVVGGHFLMVGRDDLEQFIRQEHPHALNECFFYKISLHLGGKGKRITLLPDICARLNTEPHRTFLFYTFDPVPDEILNCPQDPMYNRTLSVSKPYIL